MIVFPTLLLQTEFSHTPPSERPRVRTHMPALLPRGARGVGGRVPPPPFPSLAALDCRHLPLGPLPPLLPHSLAPVTVATGQGDCVPPVPGSKVDRRPHTLRRGEREEARLIPGPVARQPRPEAHGPEGTIFRELTSPRSEQL